MRKNNNRKNTGAELGHQSTSRRLVNSNGTGAQAAHNLGGAGFDERRFLGTNQTLSAAGNPPAAAQGQSHQQPALSGGHMHSNSAALAALNRNAASMAFRPSAGGEVGPLAELPLHQHKSNSRNSSSGSEVVCGIQMTEHNRPYLNAVKLLQGALSHYKIAPAPSTLCWGELQRTEDTTKTHGWGGLSGVAAPPAVPLLSSSSSSTLTGGRFGLPPPPPLGSGYEGSGEAWAKWAELEERMWKHGRSHSLQTLDRANGIATLGAETRAALRDSTMVASSFSKLLNSVLAEVGCSSQAEALSTQYSEQYHSMSSTQSLAFPVGGGAAGTRREAGGLALGSSSSSTLNSSSFVSNSATQLGYNNSSNNNHNGGCSLPLAGGPASSQKGHHKVSGSVSAGELDQGGLHGMLLRQYQAPSFLPQPPAAAGSQSQLLPSYSQTLPTVGQKRSRWESELDRADPAAIAGSNNNNNNNIGVFVPEALADQTARLMDYLSTMHQQAPAQSQ